MENEDQKQSVKNTVLETIKERHLKMRPKWHFIFKATLFLVGGVITLLVLFFLASFILFNIHQTGIGFIFLESLPLLIIFFLIIFGVILEILVRRYSFAYRRPLLYSALGILIIISAGAYFIDKIQFHNCLSRYAERDRLPLAGKFYRGIPRHHLNLDLDLEFMPRRGRLPNFPCRIPPMK